MAKVASYDNAVKTGDAVKFCGPPIRRFSGGLRRAERNIVMANLSVCLSVCLSNAGTVSKRMDIPSHFLNCLVGE